MSQEERKMSREATKGLREDPPLVASGPLSVPKRTALQVPSKTRIQIPEEPNSQDTDTPPTTSVESATIKSMERIESRVDSVGLDLPVVLETSQERRAGAQGRHGLGAPAVDSCGCKRSGHGPDCQVFTSVETLNFTSSEALPQSLLAAFDAVDAVPARKTETVPAKKKATKVTPRKSRSKSKKK